MGKIKILLTGGNGRLGRFLQKNFNQEKYELYSPISSELNILDQNIETILEKYKPNIILHAAAYTDVKKAEVDYLKAIEVNVNGTINLLKYAIKKDIDFIYISTDAVFDGFKGKYKTDDPVNPKNKYAKTKTAAELICRTYNKSIIIRTAFFEYDFPYDSAFYDQYTSKDYIDIIGPKILNVIYNYKYGIYHVGSERKNLYEIAISRKKDVVKRSRKEFNFFITADTSFDEEKIYGEL